MFAEICKEYTFHWVRKGCRNSAAESSRKFRGNLRSILCNDPFPNDPISESLSPNLDFWRTRSADDRVFVNHSSPKRCRQSRLGLQKLTFEFMHCTKHPNVNQEWPWQTKPQKGQFMNFSQGHSGTKVRFCESCLFSQGKTPEFTQKWAKFMNLSFWPFLWFGLPGRLLSQFLRSAQSESTAIWWV